VSDEHGTLAPERILELSERLSRTAGASISEICSINREAKMLAINALITAARAGESGHAFAVVAEEFRRIANDIDEVANTLDREARSDLKELSEVGAAILGHIRGQRLADLALNAIEIIDRNLYERTCDVRWWATDSAVVDALADPAPERLRHASSRLGVILDAYTVYLDLWICDAAGKVVATGRPDRYPRSRAASVSTTRWFSKAMATASGDEFVACDIEQSQELDGEPVATYAAAIRRDGRADGEPLGVLAIHFDWRTQARAVVDGVRLTEEERERSRVLLLDNTGRVLAASDRHGELTETFRLPEDAQEMGSYARAGRTVGYAITPGYETYRGLGWYGCIVQAEPRTAESAAA
jgi:hypothetical protein